MESLLTVRVTPAEGGWRLLVSRGGLRPLEGRVHPAAAAAALEAAGALAETEGDDEAFSRAEARAGRALSAALRASPEIRAALERALAAAGERAAAVLIDAPDRALRALPWELLSDHPEGLPLESRGVAAVLRLGDGEPPAPPPGPPQTLIWSPDPEDPIAAEVTARLARLCAARGLPPPADALDPPPGPALLHLVAHGEERRHLQRLLADEAGLGTDAAVHALGPALRSAALVFVAICEGGAPLPSEREELVARLLRAGAPAVVAPRDRLDIEVAGAFLEGLYGALGAGLPDAVAAGRRRVRALATPYADARWHQLSCAVGSLQAAAAPLPGAGAWTPPGWPAPGPEAAALLERARALAEARGDGFIGVEHLLLCAGRMPGGRRLSPPAQVSERLDRFRQCRPEAPLALSPRLASLGAALPAGCDEPALWEALFDRAGLTVRALLGHLSPAAEAPGGETMPATAAEGSGGAPPDALEVIGGPEDGRWIAPAPGETLGRWSESGRADHHLYSDTRVEDAALSRAHLRWLGPGEVERLRPCGRRRELAPGRQPLASGELLALTRLSWIAGARSLPR